MEKKLNLVMAHHLLGAPPVTEKKLVLKNIFEKNVQNMIRNMTESLKYFFKISSHSWTWNKVLDINKV